MLCQHGIHLPPTQHLQGGRLHGTLRPGCCLLEPVGKETAVLACGSPRCVLSPMSSDIGDKVAGCNVSQTNPPGEPACTLPHDTTT